MAPGPDSPANVHLAEQTILETPGFAHTCRDRREQCQHALALRCGGARVQVDEESARW